MTDLQKFHHSAFFDLSHFHYSELLTKDEHVWETVKNIHSFIEELFSSGKIKGNYAENVYIDPTATVDKTARIDGPTIIGAHAQVQFCAFIGGNVLADENVVIGPFTEVKSSVLLNTVKLSHRINASHSLLGNEVRLGAGAVITNKRVDRTNILIKIDEETKIDTSVTKFGAIIGDLTRVGANAVINPGTIIGQRSLIYPLESVHGVHGDGEVIK